MVPLRTSTAGTAACGELVIVNTVGNTKFWTWLLAVATGTLLISGVVFAIDVPKDKQEIKIEHLKGKKGAVTFPHHKHATEFKNAKGEPLTCKTCHHTEKAEPKSAKEVKGCPECHMQEGQPQKEFNGKKAPYMATKSGDDWDKKSVIFHKVCLDCHKKLATAEKPIDKCKNCHGGK